MIIQALHEIQHEHGYLPRSALEAFARKAKVSLHRIQAVASSFPHFRLTPPPKFDVKVCRDMACHLNGAAGVLQVLQSLSEGRDPATIQVSGVSCMGRCDRPPVLVVNDQFYAARNDAQARAIVEAALAGKVLPPDSDRSASVHVPMPWRIDPYTGSSDYQAVRKLVGGSLTADGLIAELKTADLRGMGGAGVPAARKWADVRAARGAEKFIVCNADESEPATFKDRELLLRTPHLIVEGVILAGLVTGATHGYVYIRHEYQEQIAAVNAAIAEAERLGVCGRNILGTGRAFPVEVFISPGGYICGEQSALIEAMEDRPAQPRNKPPQLETNGLYDKPTIVNNVETLAWTPAIALHGGAWYAQQGAEGYKGRRFFSICGDLVRPGVYEVPCGIRLRELIEQHGGGLPRGLKAFAPSGPSGGFLPARIPVSTLRAAKGTPAEEWLRASEAQGFVDVLDLRLDLQFFRDIGLMLGAGLAVYGEGRDIASQAVNGVEFYRNESCGKCVPCRIGSQKLVEIGTDLLHGHLDRKEFEATRSLVNDLGRTLEQTSICGLGAVAANPLTTALKYFPDDVDRYLAGS